MQLLTTSKQLRENRFILIAKGVIPIELRKLLTAANQEGLLVKEQPLTEHDGLIRGSHIAIRKDIETQAEKSCVLAEEIGHYRTSSGNILDQNKVESRKQEYHSKYGVYAVVDNYVIYFEPFAVIHMISSAD